MNDDQPLIKTDCLDVITAVNAAMARESFAVFRRTIRPDMLWSPFVGLITGELQKFHEAFVAGKPHHQIPVSRGGAELVLPATAHRG